MPELNPEHLKSVIEITNQGPFFEHMSMKVTELGVGYSKVVVEISKKHMNPYGALHGGVFSSAIDSAAYWSVYCDIPEEQGLISLDIKVDFLAPVLDQTVFVTGKRIKAGKSIFLAEAQMFSKDEQLVAHGTSKIMAINNKQTMSELVYYMSGVKLPPKFIRKCYAN